ncbi:hypothetical protein F4776DRAFT_658017 [Hypoxylon sp. NC0597]|nr:hypothetical protein F4776DRAFT_658017 [Hypoxylon sp. NC0597]
MLIQYDNNSTSMESTTIQRKGTTLPLRTLQPQSSQLNIGRLTGAIYEKSDGTLHRTYIPEPPYSPISERSGSSFSRGSNRESWGIIPTEPSPPQTPKSKYELDDLPRLDLVPPRPELLKREDNSPEQGVKDTERPPVLLPGVNCLLPTANHEGRRATSRYRARGFLNTPSSSPEPNDGYTLSSKTAAPAAEDPIVKWLNLRRQESGYTKSLLPRPGGLGEGSAININLDFGNTTPVFYREKQQYTPQFRGYCRRPPQKSSPPREVAKKGRNRANDPPHNNIKYTLEEQDYIRFNKYEKKLSWDDNKKLFRLKFPMADARMDRETQGIQGCHYRDNTHVPALVDRGRRLVFLNNGHVKAVMAKVREQGENKPYYSLHYLYPERAILYDWVPDEFKQVAAELIKERTLQREAARQKAISRGLWKDKLETGECACCPKPDRERDNHKRSLPSPPPDDDAFALPGKRRRSSGLRRPTITIPDGGEMETMLYTREQLDIETKRRLLEPNTV